MRLSVAVCSSFSLRCAACIVLVLATPLFSSASESAARKRITDTLREQFEDPTVQFNDVLIHLHGDFSFRLEHREESIEAIAQLHQAFIERHPDLIVKGTCTTLPIVFALADRETLAALLEDPRVRGVSHDARLRPLGRSAVPYVGAHWVQDLGVTGAGVTVAVLDTGANVVSSDLAMALHPLSITIEDCLEVAGFADNPMAPHGTQMVGAIASNGDLAPRGVAPDAQVLMVRVSDGVFFTGNLTAPVSNVICGIDYVLANLSTVAAINISLGFVPGSGCSCDVIDPLYEMFEAAIAEAVEDFDIPVICAAGVFDGFVDCGTVTAPACLPSATPVAAVYDQDYGSVEWGNVGTLCTDATTAPNQLTCFTARPPCDSLAAPGVLVTLPGSANAANGNPGYLIWSGSSVAAAYTTGIVALLSQRASDLGLARLSPAEVEELLFDTGVPTLDNDCVVAGEIRRVDALAALNRLGPVGCDPPDALTAVSDTTTGEIVTSWNNGAVYDTLMLTVYEPSGAVVTTLALLPTDTTAVTTPLVPGEYRVRITAECGALQRYAFVDITHVTTPNPTHIIWSPRDEGGNDDSPSVIAPALQGLGESVAIVDSLSHPLVATLEPGDVLWCCLGTLLFDAAFSTTDAAILIAQQAAGVSIYLEGATLWTSWLHPMHAFADYDGVAGRVTDGFVGCNLTVAGPICGENQLMMVVPDMLSPINLTGLGAPYLPDNPATFWAGLIEATGTGPYTLDIPGSGASVIWRQNITGGDPVGTYYAPSGPFGNVLCQTWELGGYDGNLPLLIERYIQQLPKPPMFRLGDLNGDNNFGLPDAIALLTFLFSGGEVECVASADVNADGSLTLADPLLLLNELFVMSTGVLTSQCTNDDAGDYGCSVVVDTCF